MAVQSSNHATVGMLVRCARLQAGLTQEELAERAQTSARTISDVERGIVRVPQPHILQQLEDALDVLPEDRGVWEEAVRASRALRTISSSGSQGRRDTEAGSPHNLPVPPTSFIGRHSEVGAVVELLTRADVRLLTLTGPGGTGKTRLAIEAAGRVLEEFDDGVVFVALGAVADPSRVLATIQRTMDVAEKLGASSEDAVQEHLRHRHVLLVLDTFEHLLPAAPAVGRLLSICPKLTVLVTSRTLLHLSGEHQFSVPPMSLPLGSVATTRAEVERHDATSLFVHRARAIEPNFTVTQQNAPLISAICARLDGLPLAIELAAVRVDVLSLPALLDRLSHRLTLLSRGPLDAPPRQQTIRATIGWSYRLLDEAEQRLLARLAVFAGGCTVEAAQAVCGEDGRDAFEDLSSLVESSLLRVVETVGSEPRFLLLDTIHEYALERLQERGEDGVVRGRHAEYFVGLAEHVYAEISSTRIGPPFVPEEIKRLEQEHSDIIAALTWLREQRQWTLALRLVGALFPVWASFLFSEDLRFWLEELAPYRDAVPPLVRARFLLALGDYQLDTEGGRGDAAAEEGAIALIEEALAIYRNAGDEHQLLRGLVAGASAMVYHQAAIPGMVYNVRVPTICLEKAERLYAESLELGRKLESSRAVAGSLFGLATVAENLRHDRSGAVALVEQALAIHLEAGNRDNVANIAAPLGCFLIDEGDRARAAALLTESLAWYRDTGNRVGLTSRSWVLGWLKRVEGDQSGIIPLVREVLQDRPDEISAEGKAAWLMLIASSAAAQGRTQRAAQLFGAVDAFSGMTLPPVSRTIDPAEIVEADRTGLRAQLGEDAWRAAREQGHVLTLEQAIDLALEEGSDSCGGRSAAGSQPRASDRDGSGHETADGERVSRTRQQRP